MESTTFEIEEGQAETTRLVRRQRRSEFPRRLRRCQRCCKGLTSCLKTYLNLIFLVFAVGAFLGGIYIFKELNRTLSGLPIETLAGLSRKEYLTEYQGPQ